MSRPAQLASTIPPIAPSAADDAPTFKQFQAKIEATVRETAAARKLLHAQAVAAHAQEEKDRRDLKRKPAAIVVLPEIPRPLEPAEEDDRVTLLLRLSSPTPESIPGIASLLARHLDAAKGELILSIGAHNLQLKTLASLFDHDRASPYVEPVEGQTLTEEVVLPRKTVDEILATFVAISAEINATTTILDSRFTSEGVPLPPTEVADQAPNASSNDPRTQFRWTSRTLKLLVRRIPESAMDLIECRVAVVGNVDAGKSSLLGVLTKGRLDDGRGRARVSLFRHKHELESGRTSSVGVEVLGFNPSGLEVMHEHHHKTAAPSASATGEKQSHEAAMAEQLEDFKATRKQQMSWEEIAAQASKIIGFSDLAGHERYLSTTLFGLCATLPDFVLLIVGANQGLIGMCKEHLSVTLALSIPVVVVVTKVDMTPPNVLEATLKQLVKVLRSPGCRKQPVFVKDKGMSIELALGFVKEKTCPIFLASSVSGEGLDMVKTFLNAVPTGGGEDGRYSVEDALEFSISDVFSVPFVGAVVSGVILSGSVSVGDNVLLGPDSLGNFAATSIKSIQRKRVNVLHAEAGQSVSFALKRIKRSGVRKGMVILEKNDLLPPKAVRRFEGQVLILYHNTLIVPKYQAMLHVGSVRQTVQIESIVEKGCLRTGDRATVAFKFLKQAEHVKVGERILFREGKTKGLGVITKILD